MYQSTLLIDHPFKHILPGILPISLALCYGLIFFISCYGWGSFISRTFFNKTITCHSLRLAWGLATIVFLGGSLSTFSLATTKLNFSIIAIGLISFIISLIYKKEPLIPIRPKLYSFGLWSTHLYCWLYAVYTPYFNRYDDEVIYLAFSKKLADTGGFGLEPFFVQKLMSTLGGDAYLRSLAIQFLSDHHISLLEEGIGMSLLIILVLEFLPNKTQAVIKFLMTVLLINLNFWVVNLSSLVIPTALLLALFKTITIYSQNKTSLFSTCVLAGLLAASIASMKNIFWIPVFLIAIFSCIQRWRKLSDLLKGIMTGLLATIFFLAPWMISLYYATGTFLYPFLGKGTLSTSLGSSNSFFVESYFLKNLIEGWETLIPIVILGIFCLISKLCYKANLFRSPFFFLILSSLLAITFFSTLVLQWRYVVSMVQFFIIVTLLHTLYCLSSLHLSKKVFLLSSIIIVLFVTNHYSEFPPMTFRKKFFNGLRHYELFLASDRSKSYLAMQEHLPEKEKALLFVNYAKELNFSRNEFYLLDFPGVCAPPGEWGDLQNAKNMIMCLKSSGIHYIVSTHSMKKMMKDLFSDKYSQSLLNDCIRTTRDYYKRTLPELRKLTTSIYDDGDLFILKL